MKYFITLLTFIFALLTLSFAQIPGKLSYQGLLTTPSGVPVQDGSYDIKFELYNALTGGTLRYSETQTSVIVQRGTFSVSIGTVTPLSSIFAEPLFVEVSALAGPGISSVQTFSPRSELTSAPYSLAPWVPNGNDISYSQGNIGVGTTTPSYKLDVNGIINATDIYKNGVPFSGGSSNTDLSFAADADANGTGEMTMATNGNERVRITNSGNVGIGTNSPTAKLDIAGDVRVSGSLHAGVWQIIYETDITTNTTEVTISGLDGDVDKEYQVVTRFRSEAGAVDLNYSIRINNDAGANYGFQLLYGTGSTTVSSQSVNNNFGLPLGDASNTGNLSTGKVTIYAKSGYPRTHIGEWLRSDGGSPVYKGTFGGVWNNNNDNITSLTILANASNGIGVGSHIEVWARR